MNLYGTLSGFADRLMGIRRDSWVNALTGFGTSRDKTTATEFVPDPPIPDVTLTSLFNHSDMARKIVILPPREMMRQGYSLQSKNINAVDAVEDKMADLKANARVFESMVWGRLYGGCLLYVGANDGMSADTPLREELVTSVDFLDVLDKRRCSPHKFCRDVTDPNHGKPEVYMINHLSGGTAYIHRSRVIRFGGAMTDEESRQTLNHWDYSILQAIDETIAGFDEAFKASRIMMTDASQAVFKLKGLISMIAGGQKDALYTRAMLLDTLRSVSRAIFLDADHGEEFTRVQTTFSGVADILDRSVNRLAAATEIPVTLLMGQAPAGLNATGASDIRIFYDLIKSQQTNELTPKLMRLIRLFAIGAGYRNERFKIEYHPLWQETPGELATRRQAIATADLSYINGEVFTPEEVAKVRGRATGWDGPIVVNLALRETAEEGPATLVPPGPKPPVPPPPGPAAPPAPGG